MSADGTSFFDVPTPPSARTPPSSRSWSPMPHPGAPALPARPTPSTPSNPPTARSSTKPPRAAAAYASLSEPETQVVVELLFAVITELYTLSSAWQIRLALLTAAKSFLLRPGNPSLVSITTLLQTQVLDANTSDAGVAAHLRKLRENAMPTADEREKWPGEASERDKEERRVRARRLLVERGMPSQLTSVMGSVASGEALGRVFDALQEGAVARGLVFGLLLQGVRGVVQ